VKYTIEEILRATNGDWPEAPAGLTVGGWSIDSRTIAAGDLFFAFRGEVKDGHDFVEEALAKGACAAVVRRDFRRADGGRERLILCDDGLQALHRLASWSREERGLRLIGITGSVGKTTTKDIAAALLEGQFRVSRNQGNLNNIWGLPVALLRRPEQCDLYICELGMSYPGEMGRIARIARPDIALFTNIHGVHRVNFKSEREIAEAKAELFEGLRPGAPTVVNADNAEAMRIAVRSGHPLVTFGIEAEADVSAADITEYGIEGTESVISFPGGEAKVRLPLPGVHNLYNLLAAVAVGVAVEAHPSAMLERIGEVRLSPLRSKLTEFAEGWTLYNDAYNSNPPAMRHVMPTFASSSGFRRRVAVLGDMLELGPLEKKEHWEIGTLIGRLGIDRLITVGRLSVNTARAAVEAGMPASDVSCYETTTEVLEALTGEIRPGDLVLIKGSRGVKMETIVNGLMNRFQARDSNSEGESPR
jgi:UDP-N-acetylmuramoyl-tripeptide--D-alanyl-D-alanine ligase